MFARVTGFPLTGPLTKRYLPSLTEQESDLERTVFGEKDRDPFRLGCVSSSVEDRWIAGVRVWG